MRSREVQTSIIMVRYSYCCLSAPSSVGISQEKYTFLPLAPTLPSRQPKHDGIFKFKAGNINFWWFSAWLFASTLIRWIFSRLLYSKTRGFFYIICVLRSPPITVVARSKAWTVFALSNTGAMGWIPLEAFCVYVAALRRADPPSKSPTDCV
jgi:hypothetical protein